MLSNKIRYFAREAARLVNRARWHLIGLYDAVRNSDTVIIVTEGWCLVNNTGTTIGCDIGIIEDFESPVSKLPLELSERIIDNNRQTNLVSEVREERLIFPALHFVSFNGSKFLVLGGLKFGVKSS